MRKSLSQGGQRCSRHTGIVYRDAIKKIYTGESINEAEELKIYKAR